MNTHLMSVPFYSQKWDLANWKDLGFKNFDEAKYWERSSCGILCLKMAMDAYISSNSKKMSPRIHDLIKKGVEIGAYDDSLGWKHDGLVRLANEFEFFAERNTEKDSQALSELLEDNSLLIVSIKWAFHNHKTVKEQILFWKKYGGHLALVIGYENDSAGNLIGFYVHHTSIRQDYNWEAKLIPIDVFEKGFTGRYIKVNDNS